MELSCNGNDNILNTGGSYLKIKINRRSLKQSAGYSQ